MSWEQGLKESSIAIAVAFHVPCELLGMQASKTYSNYQEARRAFYMETILPLMNKMLGKLNHRLTPAFDKTKKLFLDYDSDSIEALQEDRNALWDRIKSASFLTINEMREAVGYEAIDIGDALLMPSTVIPEPINQPLTPPPAGAPTPPPEGNDNFGKPPAGEPPTAKPAEKRRATDQTVWEEMTELARKFERGEA
jgi:hypothetical protein